MKNIVWQQSDGSLGIHWLREGLNSSEEAYQAMERGLVDTSWSPVAFDCDLPEEPQSTWRYVDGVVVADQALLATIQKLRIPQSVTRRQARLALLLSGRLEAVQQAIEGISDPLQRGLMEIDWNDAQTFERNSPTLQALAVAIGLNESQLDELFTAAAAL